MFFPINLDSPGHNRKRATYLKNSPWDSDISFIFYCWVNLRNKVCFNQKQNTGWLIRYFLLFKWNVHIIYIESCNISFNRFLWNTAICMRCILYINKKLRPISKLQMVFRQNKLSIINKIFLRIINRSNFKLTINFTIRKSLLKVFWLKIVMLNTTETWFLN